MVWDDKKTKGQIMRKQNNGHDPEKQIHELPGKLSEHFEGVWVFGFHRETGMPFVTARLPDDGPCADVMETFLDPLCEWGEKHKDAPDAESL